MPTTPQDVRRELKKLSKTMKNMSEETFHKSVSRIQDVMELHFPSITTSRDLLLDVQNIHYMNTLITKFQLD
ncbi:unnamed protein product, partial [Aphanomyces euteiches]